MKPILVIDDEPDIRDLVQLFLEEDGYEVITAPDGIQGIEAFTRSQPPVVITDIRMPAMEGTEVLSKIKSARPETEVIVITGHGEMKLAIEALQNDASDFIQKPFGYDVLSVAVRRAFNKISVREQLAQTQVHLLQTEKMASLGQLAAGIAHEINNPVGFVTSNLGTLTKFSDNIRNAFAELQTCFENGGSLLSAEEYEKIKQKYKIDFVLADMVSIIEESLEGTNRVKHIVRDLKDFSHIDTRKMIRYDINESVKSTLNILTNETKHKADIELHLGDIPAVTCNPQQINQVVMNLVLNGIQAIEEYGKIGIRTSKENNGVRLEISDTGGGIPEDLLLKIFDPFFTTKDVGSGTGLGLHIVYNIVNRHGGVIDVDSKVGKGTTFIVHLPVQPPDYNE
ncbi:MAG: response regulator [FCB group bacterium]|nr:response regulator [FCB group bacterium]